MTTTILTTEEAAALLDVSVTRAVSLIAKAAYRRVTGACGYRAEDVEAVRKAIAETEAAA